MTSVTHDILVEKNSNKSLYNWQTDKLKFLYFQYQSKSVTPVDEYKCTLDQELLSILENELRETEEIRNYAITAMREWILQNPRIKKMRLDSAWILKHLRFKKYSLPMAQDVMERFIVLRSGNYGSDNWHIECDVLRPCVKKIFDVK